MASVVVLAAALAARARRAGVREDLVVVPEEVRVVLAVVHAGTQVIQEGRPVAAWVAAAGKARARAGPEGADKQLRQQPAPDLGQPEPVRVLPWESGPWRWAYLARIFPRAISA